MLAKLEKTQEAKDSPMQNEMGYEKTVNPLMFTLCLKLYSLS